MRRTEGWPAGLYLAALSLRDQPDRGRALAHFAGDDRLVADYLRDELLAEQSGDRVSFLTRTSVLGDLSGPLCDAVLGGPGSGGTLRELARSNLLLVPLDRGDARYRYHGLFAQMLQAELHRLEPEYEGELHRRASEWHAGRGEVDRAIHHAIAAEDVGCAGDLLWSVAADHLMNGRHATIRRWLDRFTPEQIAGHPPLALTAAAAMLVAGDRDLLEHWCSAAERGLGSGSAGSRPAPRRRSSCCCGRSWGARGSPPCAGTPPRPPSGSATTCRGWRCAAWRRASPTISPAIATPRAPELEDGARLAAVAAPAVQVLCLAQLGVVALDDDDADTGELCIARARAQVERVGLGDDPLCALVFAASALSRAQRGRVDDARRDMREGTRLLTLLAADFAPWYEAEVRILLARAALRLSDIVAARTLLAEASRLARRAPDAVVLSEWLDEAWARADSFSAAAIMGPTSLTTAELRVLRLLPTHLSFREIAAHLHVSANTIKTQAHAVYRKLGASSRTEAVAGAREVGLLDA